MYIVCVDMVLLMQCYNIIAIPPLSGFLGCQSHSKHTERELLPLILFCGQYPLQLSTQREGRELI